MKTLTFEKSNEVLKTYGYKKFNNQIGDGWATLLKGLFESLKEVALNAGLKNLKVTVIKEKFAGLRVYTNMDGKNAALDKILSMSESTSRTVCEFCGNPGEEFTFGFWRKTSCEPCAIINNGEKPKTMFPIAFRGDFR